MRRTILLLAVTTAALLVASGAALAITKTCKVGSVCKGTAGADVITGTKKADTIKALAGADTIKALAANDRLDGGGGDDTYAFGSRWGKDVITADASGTDTADFSAIGGGNTIDVDLTTKAGSEVFNSIHGTVNWPGSVIENVNGGAGTDFVEGNAAANVLRGNGGGDYLSGELGDDALRAGEGTDELDGGDGNDTLEGGGGGRPGEFDDLLVGGAGDDTITDTGPGSPAGDILEGGTGDDELRAGADGDILEGDAGNDTLYGEGGDDIYVFGQGWGTDEIVETDISHIQFSGTGAEEPVVSTNLTIDLMAGRATDGANVLTFPGQLVSNVEGGNGNDSITGSAAGNFVRGEGGDDVIDVAGGGSDGVFCGDGNNDHVKYDASDTIYAGCELFTFVP